MSKFSRIVLFILYSWFGILKLFGTSPATAMVSDLQQIILPFIDSDVFLILLGLAEIAIGVMFLIPRITNIAVTIFLLHMVSTFMPLILLPALVWNDFLTPTLEGQYIIKNLALIAVALNVWNEGGVDSK